MKKSILTFCIGLAAAFLLCGCTVEGNPLPDGMDETMVLDTGRTIVTELNEGDWQVIYDLLREDAKITTGSPEAIQAHMQAVLEKVGAFQSEEEAMATGQTVKETGEQYATAVFYCQHEKNQAMYRIAFSTDMELIGLQVTKQ